MKLLKRKLLLVYGTRPEAIKLGPVVQAARPQDRLDVEVLFTGQHVDMVAPIHSLFGVHPRWDLGLGRREGGIGRVLAGTIKGTDRVIEEYAPDAVMVQGDTASALGAALAAYYREIPVVHLEAGLRTFDKRNPFPEEANRVLISEITSLHLAATPLNRDNLVAEGVPGSDIQVVGNTVIDAIRQVLVSKDSIAPLAIVTWLSDRKYVVVTTHRRESWDAGIGRIAEAIAVLASRYSDTAFVVPMHANPIVRTPLEAVLGDIRNVLLTEPIEYGPFCRLMADAALLMTDSGGIQEEATAIGVPVVVMREVTERREVVDMGLARIAGTSTGEIVSAASAFMIEEKLGDLTASLDSPYGDGHAVPRVLTAVTAFLEQRDTTNRV